MLAYKPHKKQAAAHRAFLVDKYTRGTLFWGRQVGKSLWSVKHLEMAACFQQGQYFIVFNTHKHARDVMWRQYLHTIPKELIYETNATDLVITLNYVDADFNLPGIGKVHIKHDEDQPRSTIQLLGSDYADDHRGRKAHGMIFDEYQDQAPENWDSVYKYFFATTKGWACFMGTAKGYNHWYDLLEFAKKDTGSSKRWFYQEATWRDNPVVDEEWYHAERQEAEDTGTLDVFMQEVELQFRTVHGSVYPMFDRNIHVISPNDKRLPEDGTLWGVWDFGYAEGHPMAFNLIDIDNHGDWFVIDEIHGTGISMDEMIDLINMKVGDRRLAGIVCDSASPALIEIAKTGGLPAFGEPKKQGSVKDGIALLAAKMQPKIQLVGEPVPNIYFTDNCKHTIYQMENYRYREHVIDRPQPENPMKIDDDHPDAIRYLALHLKYGHRKSEKPIPNSVAKSTNRFGI